ncbi:hypothetical protein [Parabacteroides sp. PF5-6]|uniref:hypothetical protein n=1 Tax=Parabacteroides sp. PF5-6 TaxID=1742403 RepID=UPI002405968F|nr:hypothetical protein [Parabacteroides sp. PF5-6]MDF9831752.1 hypothetical protein [Parabacteroides sp. PF5-6]
MIKKNYHLPLIAALFSLVALSCDDGRIYPSEPEEATGGKAAMQVVFHGEEAWPKEYIFIFAAFGEEGKIPLKSKIISRPEDVNIPVAMMLNGLNEETKTISIAVVNKGRELIYDFYSYPVDDLDKEILLPVTEIDLARYDRVQQQVFEAYCIRCHGAGTHAAAGLDLTAGNSHKALVNRPATLSKEGLSLVAPGQPAGSFLLEILREDLIQYNHTDVLPEAELIDLVETWIRNDAKE